MVNRPAASSRVEASSVGSVSNEPGVEVVLDDASAADHSIGTVERRPPWFVAAIVVVAIGALIVVSLATRTGGADEGAETKSPPSTSIAPTTTTTTTTAPERASTTSTIEPASAPTIDTATVADPSGSDGFGTTVQLLPPDTDVLAAIPAEGIDAWLFTVSPQPSLTRTDLITGEQRRVMLDTSGGSVSDQFNSGVNRLVQIGDRVAIAIQSDVFIIDIETLFVSRVELDAGDQPRIIAHDDNTLWLQTVVFSDRRPVSSIRSLDTNTYELGEELFVDPVGIGISVAGAAKGIFRYHVPFVGSWELTNETSRRLPDPILAGGDGGTIELRCSEDPGDCQTVVYDIVAQTDTPIDLNALVFGMVLSPDLQWVATADGHVVNVDGTVINLPGTSGGNVDGGWTWSNTSRFLTDSNYRVFDTTGQIEIFELPRPNGFGILIGSVLFERSANEAADPTANA